MMIGLAAFCPYASNYPSGHELAKRPAKRQERAVPSLPILICIGSRTPAHQRSAAARGQLSLSAARLRRDAARHPPAVDDCALVAADVQRANGAGEVRVPGALPLRCVRER